jgi:hypothetical protein
MSLNVPAVPVIATTPALAALVSDLNARIAAANDHAEGLEAAFDAACEKLIGADAKAFAKMRDTLHADNFTARQTAAALWQERGELIERLDAQARVTVDEAKQSLTDAEAEVRARLADDGRTADNWPGVAHGFNVNNARMREEEFTRVVVNTHPLCVAANAAITAAKKDRSKLTQARDAQETGPSAAKAELARFIKAAIAA